MHGALSARAERLVRLYIIRYSETTVYSGIHERSEFIPL